MPCDSLILNQVHLGLANADILRAALEALGCKDIGRGYFYFEGYRYQIVNGELQFPQGAPNISDRIKQAYSREVVVRANRRFGWSARTSTKNNKDRDPNKITVTRR